MTITLNARKATAAALAVLVLVVAYLVGTTHAGTAEAATATQLTALAGPTQSSQGTATGITVTGVGKVSGTPDTLRLDLTVSSSGSTVTTALANANSTEASVQKSLLSNGVAAKDLQTSGLSIQPDYVYSKSGTPSLHGFHVTETVSVALRNLGRAGSAIGAAVAAGGNAVQINQVSLSLEDTSTLVSGARDQAFSNAKAKAEQYAKAAGRALGDVLTITESVQQPTATPYNGFALAEAAPSSLRVPIQAGSQDVNVSVTVSFGFR